MSTSLLFEQLIIRNKISSLKTSNYRDSTVYINSKCVNVTSMGRDGSKQT